MKRRLDFRWPISECFLHQSLSADVTVFAEMWGEDEHESTRARGRGQFPKFGAVRKKETIDFAGRAGLKRIPGAGGPALWLVAILAV
jgi:hypothetical protein